MEASQPEPDTSTDRAEQHFTLDDIDLECSVCNHLFTDPKLPPCAHVICRQCLLTWFSTNHEATCPLCRSAIAEGMIETSTTSTDVWEKVVSDLPDDVAMAALVENARLLRADHVCVGCRQCKAVSVCLDCGDMLCGACTTTHRNLTATRNHKVKCLATMTAMKLSRSKPALCCVHPDRPSELFCPTHGSAICLLCASSVHRTCPEVTLFKEHLRTLYDKLTEDSNNLLKADTILDLELHKLDSKLKDSEKKTNQSLAEIDEACDRLEKSVETCRLRLKELVVKANQEAEQSIQDAKGELFKRRGRIATRRRLVDRVQLTSPPGKLEEASRMVQSFIQNIDNKATSDVSVISSCQVHVDVFAVKKLEQELACLGEKPSFTEDNDCAWRFSPMQNAIISKNGKTAEIVKGSHAALKSSDKMQKSILYEVRLDEVKEVDDQYFTCGVVKENNKEVVVFCDAVYVRGDEQVNIKIGNRLRNLQAGQRVGIALKDNHRIYLYIDGKQQPTYGKDTSSSLFPFFELDNSFTKITSLPPTDLKKE